MKKQKLIVSFLILLLYSCRKEASNADASPQVDIYVSGAEENGSVYVAKYWKNGKAVPLTDGTNSAWAGSVVVVGDDVYVAGSEFKGSVSIAKYWKNGQAIALTDGSQQAAANATNSIVVAGSNVYVAGTEVNGFGTVS